MEDEGLDVNGSNRTAILAGVVALLFLAVSAVVVLTLGDSSSSPAIAAIIGLIAPTVVALLALMQSERAARALNGSFDSRIRENVHRVLDARVPAGGDRRSDPVGVRATPALAVPGDPDGPHAGEPLPPLERTLEADGGPA